MRCVHALLAHEVELRSDEALAKDPNRRYGAIGRAPGQMFVVTEHDAGYAG